MRFPRIFAVAALAATAFGTTVAVPPNPRRTSPPPGVAERAVPVGAPAPALTGTPVGDIGFSWRDALAHGPVAVVFYRGYW